MTKCKKKNPKGRGCIKPRGHRGNHSYYRKLFKKQNKSRSRKKSAWKKAKEGRLI